MAEVRIKNELELARLLRKIEESRFAEDPRQVYYTRSKKADQSYYDLEEEDVPGQEDQGAPAQQQKPAPAQTPPKGQELENPPEKKSQVFSSDLNVSLDSVLGAVKKLRGGRSVNDSSVEQELRTYFDRLDTASRQALYTFLKSFSDILTGETTGVAAQDPEDPPLGLKIEPSDEAEKPAPTEKPAPAPEPEEEAQPSSEEKEPEDTTPPIAVGQKQMKESVRRRMRYLMGV